jgi:hypothetical protein
VLLNIVDGDQKSRNIAGNPRVSLMVCDPSRIHRYYKVDGHVIGMTPSGAAEHADMLSRRYTGRPYSNYTGEPETRMIVTIAVDSVTPPLLDQGQGNWEERGHWASAQAQLPGSCTGRSHRRPGRVVESRARPGPAPDGRLTVPVFRGGFRCHSGHSPARHGSAGG